MERQVRDGPAELFASCAIPTINVVKGAQALKDIFSGKKPYAIQSRTSDGERTVGELR